MTGFLEEVSVSADILIVIAATVLVFSASSIISSWTVRRWPIVSLISFAIAVGLFYYVHSELTDGLQVMDIPNAFISVAARVLN